MDDIWKLLAGLGIFLFGMYLLEEGIKTLSGKSFKRLIKNYTSNKFKAIVTGTLSTAVLQSSSAVTLIVIAFVGAGVMKLSNAIGVIVGSNLGTTVTSWIVASLGFKFSIESIALPIIAIGGLGLIFLGKEGKYANVSKLLVGFGFLFMGLDYMKNSVNDIVENIPIEILQDRNFFVYILAGFLITGLVQSSSASMALTLSALNSELIEFPEACAMVIGSNVGTTITVIIGTLGATVSMKRVAFSHFFFNLITGLTAILTFPLLIKLITDVFKLNNDPITGLAMFHTIFNVLGVLVFLPFTLPFSRLLKKIFPEKKSVYTQYIHTCLPQFPEASIISFINETIYLQHLALSHNLKCLYIDETLAIPTLKDKDGNTILIPVSSEKTYDVIKNLQSELFSFAAKLQSNELNQTEANLISRMLHCIRYSTTSAKTMKDYKHEFEALYNSDSEILTQYYQYFRQKIITLYIQLKEIKTDDLSDSKMAQLHSLTEKIKADDKTFNQTVIEKLSKKEISENVVNTLLTAQRGFSQSGRQMIVSFKDFHLSEEEFSTFNEFENLLID